MKPKLLCTQISFCKTMNLCLFIHYITKYSNERKQPTKNTLYSELAMEELYSNKLEMGYQSLGYHHVLSTWVKETMRQVRGRNVERNKRRLLRTEYFLSEKAHEHLSQIHLCPK